MPPKSKLKYDRFFTMITLAVEKKINQLGRYIESLEEDGHTGINVIQQRMLMTHTDRMRKAVDELEAEWLRVRDDIPQANLNRVHAIVDETVVSGKEALCGGEMFVCHAAQQSTTEHGPRPEGGRTSATPNSSLVLGTTSN